MAFGCIKAFSGVVKSASCDISAKNIEALFSMRYKLQSRLLRIERMGMRVPVSMVHRDLRMYHLVRTFWNAENIVGLNSLVTLAWMEGERCQKI